jgi:excisionase family DNA binding protein
MYEPNTKSSRTTPSVQPTHTSVPALAQQFSLSERTIWRLLQSGQLKFVKIGHSTRIPLNGPGGVAEFLARQQAA